MKVQGGDLIRYIYCRYTEGGLIRVHVMKVQGVESNQGTCNEGTGSGV